MFALLPSRCPGPSDCVRSWHWSKKSKQNCDVSQERWRRQNEGLNGMNGGAGPRAHKEPKWELDEDYAALSPTKSEDKVLVRNGERQLALLESDELSKLGILLSTYIFNANKLLRSGAPLDSSSQGLYDDLISPFEKLGPALDLDQPVRMYRGITGPLTLTRKADLGFSFACSDSDSALTYAVDEPRFLLQLYVVRGLCIPDVKHRSAALRKRSNSILMLDNSFGQVIFPPKTEWEILSTNSSPDVTGVTVVHMKQL